MKFWTKIKSIFNVGGEGFVLNVKSAEIKLNKVFLHPEDNDEVIYMIKNQNVDILINNGESIPEEDFIVINKKRSENSVVDSQIIDTALIKVSEKPQDDFSLRTDVMQNNGKNIAIIEPTLNSPHNAYENTTTNFNVNSYYIKKKMTITLYGDEMELMNNAIKASGLTRSDFIMACLQNSQKKSVSKSFFAECERVKKARQAHNKDVRSFYKVG